MNGRQMKGGNRDRLMHEFLAFFYCERCRQYQLCVVQLQRRRKPARGVFYGEDVGRIQGDLRVFVLSVVG